MSKSVTVIVPIYNVEKYLRTCFESLLSQTSEDFEVLAVNDGSPDNCDAIIKEYVEANRDIIRAMKKPNGGYGSVLQVAIQECRTPYFLVCDPDDSLKPDAIRKLLALAQTSTADITIGAKTLIYEEDAKETYDPAYNTTFTTLKTNTVYNKGTKEFDDLFFIDPSPHAKLYKTELAKKIHFPTKVGYTDNMLFYLSLLNASKVVYTDEALANYLINRTGNSMQDVSPRAMQGEILVFKSILTQTMQITDIPDMFYYRMFESFKCMLYKTRRLNGTIQQYEEILDYLETYLKMLTKYEERILPYYKMYSKVKILEKMRDTSLLNSAKEEKTYQNLKKKMMKEFKGSAA